ncbi:MAG: A/G-specific adenine glycosylase [Rhodocyclaceae bacterium]|uniref:Adenine DNA glycosylase n=1 Tax=Candidatus Desulfobacillus denitrificans TaxID=2608985 RepID=A0A809S1G2_9PROT|nr:A/G-specific adenine glycosylase [Rhodocyclaceae bacterium]BBO19371.1 A/G-specific adenine glycosylase [Candidatus Desulfobacillus denitrificans]GIK45448.1 MAG: A/G-specific adenine glycosylase [Betaproteobacteria bacterium]GJQ54336.1 MAG: A/G-specific adenine glycosylase [Rhodocyclaceae bacterium]
MVTEFAQTLIHWQKAAGRHDLPWQQKGRADPYRVWLSEIMLQQTQVATVIPYYRRFLARFPDLARLAAAPAEEVMALWSGLGYYARARNLQRAAQDIVARHNGRFPHHLADIEALPGIGRSTAAAIAVFAFGTRAAILDGNVRRVLARAFGIEGFPGEKAVEKRLWALAESLLPERDLVAYTQGLMDLGATLCTRGKPRCGDCPLAAQCVARREDRIAALPTPRAKRAVPQRSVRVLVLRHRGRVLLEQRPPHGIWGGLLSLPELSDGKLPRRCADALPLPVVRHAFTHFRLDIAPVLCKVSRRDTAPLNADGVWLSLKELDEAPLPAPIRKILQNL